MRSPKKPNLIIDFAKPKQKILTSDFIDADNPPDNSFQNQQSSIICENSGRPLSENMLSKEK